MFDDEDDFMDSESDPGFRNGTWVVSEKKKKKRKSGKRRADSMEESEASEVPTKKRRKSKQKTKRRSNAGPNPLREFFGNLDLHSDSSDEEVDGEIGLDFYNNSDAEEDKVDKSPKPVNKFAQYVRREPLVDDGSATEEFTDEEPAKRPARPAAPDGSETEEFSDEEPVKKAPRAPARPTPPSGSETEDFSDEKPSPPPLKKKKKKKPVADSDDESEPNRRRSTSRPGFPILPGQETIGPLVLDAAQGIQVTKAINVYLREYQRQGVKFFWERYNEGRGGLLGDDMGLGKTIQVISFLSAIMKKTGVASDRDRRRNHVSRLQDSRQWKEERKLPPANATWPTCLIIAPKSVVENWAREFEVWGYFEVGKYTGPLRAPILEDFKKGRLDVVLTSIDTARRDIDLLSTLPWSCVFVDEVHTVKNPASQTSQAFNEFECLKRFGLTGTAIQNSYDELWVILDWTSPGMLGDQGQWKGYVSNPLKRGQSASASDHETLMGKKVSQILVKQLLPRFFLRRTKEIIAHQLPTKTDEVVFCPLTEDQLKVYKKILRMPDLQAVLNRKEDCECGSGKKQMKCCLPYDPSTVFKYLHVLIKLSNHLGLILPSPKDTLEQLKRNRELADRVFPGNAPAFEMAITDAKYCGKWAILLTLLRDWRKQDKTNKVLIFTKSVKLLDMMVFQLQTMETPYGFLRFDGNTKQSDRMPMIDRFHEDPDIYLFLISTAAGGTGLNLTGANKVVIFDPNWNPAYDLQAMDRAFRFGQTRDVSVVRLLGAGSIEELVYARQVYKQQQMRIGYDASIQTRYFEGVQGEKDKQGELFGLNNMFKLHEKGLATKMAIEKAYMAELDWALTNTDAPQGKGKKRKSGGGDFDFGDAEAKLDKEYNDLKGLGALLFDDGLPTAGKNSLPAGVAGNMYTHQNADLLKDSKIEQKRAAELVQKRRRKRKKSLPAKEPEEAASGPKEQWPPIRTRNKAAPLPPAPSPSPPPSASSSSRGKPSAGPEEKLRSRMNALVGAGVIKSPDDFTWFAHQFTHVYTNEERAILLKKLDTYQRIIDGSSSDEEGGDGGMQVEQDDIDMDA
ncbi:RAD26-like SNF2 family DNA-dependent ATPase [Roridomyces roridus]|uniref:RAD26-like SNF2 family DNA-dependent ATPase n=1 Tax=Roridomyces roridus TaxID=1738132 RepID=A0AAD7BFT2_9AGAR|nr:RAD26-like SNF2 family DNA-dependent ATPase [Roridomyces roridus]